MSATRRYKLGWALMRAGDLSGADASLQRAYKDAAKGMGPEAPITAGALSLIGELRRRQRRYDDSLAAGEKANNMAWKIASDHFIAETETLLGAVLRDMKRFSDASTHFARADKRATGTARGFLRREEGLLHEAAGRKDAAAAALKEALVFYLPLGDSHPLVVEARRDYERVSGKSAPAK